MNPNYKTCPSSVLRSSRLPISTSLTISSYLSVNSILLLPPSIFESSISLPAVPFNCFFVICYSLAAAPPQRICRSHLPRHFRCRLCDRAISTISCFVLIFLDPIGFARCLSERKSCTRSWRVRWERTCRRR